MRGRTGDDIGEQEGPLVVTVVIPTTGRPSLGRAVRSVLSQAFDGVVDVVVSADTLGALDIPDDQRVRVIRVGPGVGGNAARQAGVETARGSLVALLDDDDTWLPGKIVSQLESVAGYVSDPLREPWLSVTSAVVGRGSEREIWPSRTIGPQEDFREYMFRLRSFRMGGSFIQSSSFLFPRFVTADVRFRAEQSVHQDWQWIMDFRDVHPEAPILQLPDALVDYDVSAGGLSNSFTIDDSVEFGRRRLTDRRRLLADFLLTFPVERAYQRSDSAWIRRLMVEAFRAGLPTRYAVGRAAARYVQSLFRARIGRRGAA